MDGLSFKMKGNKRESENILGLLASPAHTTLKAKKKNERKFNQNDRK